MSLLAKGKGEVTYKDLTSLHKWALVVLISMGSSIIYAPMYLKNVFYDPLMQALGCTNADLGLMVSAYGIAAMICYLPSGIVADKFRMRTLATVGFLGGGGARGHLRHAAVGGDLPRAVRSDGHRLHPRCGGAPASR